MAARAQGALGFATYTAPVSETSSKSGADTRISLRKPTKRTGGPADPGGELVTRIPTPSTIDYACAALIAVAVGVVVRALGLLGSTGTLETFVKTANAKAKKPKNPYTAHQIANDIHALRQGTLIEAAVITVAVLLLVVALRRVRSASGTRWALLIMLVLTSLPFYVVPISGFPAIPKIAGVVVGLASVAALLLIFVPPASQKYFRDCREANTPPELRGQPRPGLFGPRRPREPRGMSALGRAAAGGAVPNRPAKAAKARSKVRSEADAVAHGAELARSRAKAAGKSRRTSG